jgi:hypothetical protein
MQLLRESVSTGAKEDESSTWRVWAAGFYNDTARSPFVRVLKLRELFFISCTVHFQAMWKSKPTKWTIKF